MTIRDNNEPAPLNLTASNWNSIREMTSANIEKRDEVPSSSVDDITNRVINRLTDTNVLLPGLEPIGSDSSESASSTIDAVSEIIDEEIILDRTSDSNPMDKVNTQEDIKTNKREKKRGQRQWNPADEPEMENLAPNADSVLRNRYLSRDENGEIVESPKDLFLRVASAVAQGEKHFKAKNADVLNWTHKFYNLMSSLKFLPNSPTMVNAGKDGKGSLSACFVTSPEDSMDSIMQVAYDAAMIEKWGGGIGFGFSNLRPKGDPIATTHGMACGPVAVMKLYSAVGATLTQGAFRLGAHMGQLNISHPDIREFIHAKDDDATVQNFNISVQVTDEFMVAVRDDKDWDLITPRTGEVIETVKARELWQEICESAWKTGDPGIVFMDRVWETAPNPQMGRIQTSNPCGEEFLEDYGNCCLGSIDLGKHLLSPDPSGGFTPGFDWNALEDTVRLGVRFLDDVIEVNTFPIEKLREVNLATRRIGLGVMGWADALVSLGIPYDSEEAIALANRVGKFIKDTAWSESAKLADTRGTFPEYERSGLKEKGLPPVRHSSVVTIAPTGSISRIADCSSGIEPHFALAWWSNILWEDHEGTSARFLDAPIPVRKALISEMGEDKTETILEQLAEDPDSIDDNVRTILNSHGVRTSMVIEPEWHVRMQAAWQDNVTNSVSKTINLPNSASVADIEKSFLLAWETDCKAITVYRDGSKNMQVLETGASSTEDNSAQVDLVSPIPRERPSVINGVTEKIRTGHGSMYITINFDEAGSPFEIFSALGKAGGCDSAYLEAISRLASLSLRSGVNEAEVIDQLRGITCCPTWDQGVMVSSSPDAVALALMRHQLAHANEGEIAIEPEAQQSSLFAAQETKVVPLVAPEPVEPEPTTGRMGGLRANQCPECYGTVTFEEGCLKCYSCGYSKC